MADNHTLIKLSLYNVTKNEGWTHWHCFYDTSIIFSGIRQFEKRYDSISEMYNDYDLKLYDTHNIFWKEGIYKGIGLMIRGFKCYKRLKKKTIIPRDHFIQKDVVKEFVIII